MGKNSLTPSGLLPAAQSLSAAVPSPPVPNPTTTGRYRFWSWRRWPLRLVLLAVLLVCLALGAGNWYRYFQSVAYYRRAEKARQVFDYPRAQHLAQLCLQAWPNDPQTYFLLARI